MGVTITGLGETLALTRSIERDLFAQPTTLLKVWGTRLLREVDDIFRAQGKPPWAPLRPSTIAAKRQGKGSGSPQALSGLRASADATISGPREVTVYLGNPLAVFHEFGTKGPYEIKPKHGKALALPFLPGRDAGKGTAGTGKAGRKSLAGLGRATNTGRGSFNTPAGARTPFTNVSFRRKVIHPGLPARPMLPTMEQAVPILRKETVALVNFLVTKQTGGSRG